MILFIFLVAELWIGGHFVKIYKSKSEREVVKGEFYKPLSGAMSFIVDSPLTQIITFNEDTMIVYYPHRKLAFKIKSIENVYQKTGLGWDLGEFIESLKRRGYIFLKKVIENDTIYSYWTHEKLGTTLLIVYDRENRIYKVEVKDDNGKELYRIEGASYIKVKNGLYFPLHVATISPLDTEIFEFTSVREIKNDSLPYFIKKPVLPDSVKVILKNFEE